MIFWNEEKELELVAIIISSSIKIRRLQIAPPWHIVFRCEERDIWVISKVLISWAYNEAIFHMANREIWQTRMSESGSFDWRRQSKHPDVATCPYKKE